RGGGRVSRGECRGASVEGRVSRGECRGASVEGRISLFGWQFPARIAILLLNFILILILLQMNRLFDHEKLEVYQADFACRLREGD
ncbi:MAG: hypothetical protein ABSH34_18130, partial [Verrucomicrobiota bacterium]